jgi:hypothetical protein
MSKAKCVTGWGFTQLIFAVDPHPALVRFAFSRHPPRKGEGYNTICTSITTRSACRAAEATKMCSISQR